MKIRRYLLTLSQKANIKTASGIYGNPIDSQKESVSCIEVTKIGGEGGGGWFVLVISKDSKPLCGFSTWYIA